MVPHVLGFNRDSGSPVWRVGFQFLIADAAISDESLDVARDCGPDGIALDHEAHFLVAGVTRHVASMDSFEDVFHH